MPALLFSQESVFLIISSFTTWQKYLHKCSYSCI